MYNIFTLLWYVNRKVKRIDPKRSHHKGKFFSFDGICMRWQMLTKPSWGNDFITCVDRITPGCTLETYTMMHVNKAGKEKWEEVGEKIQFDLKLKNKMRQNKWNVKKWKWQTVWQNKKRLTNRDAGTKAGQWELGTQGFRPWLEF